MKKIFTLTAGLLLTAGVFAQSVLQLVEPTKVNFRPKQSDKTMEFKETEVFLNQTFQGMDPLANFTLESAMASVGWELDSSRATDAVVIPELNDVANGAEVNLFAVSNDSKNEALNGANDASEDYLSTASLDFTAIKETVILQFRYFTSGDGTFLVEASVDGGAFETVETLMATDDWTNAYIDLANYADESDVVIRFNHNDEGSTNSVFAIDNLNIRSLETDLTLDVNADHSYTNITVDQLRPITFTVTVSNNGLKDETAVVLAGLVTDPSGNETNYDATFDLAAETDTVIEFGPYTQQELGEYAISFSLESNDGVEETIDDNVFAFNSSLNDSILTRDNGEYNTSVPVGNNVDVGVGIPGNIIAVSQYDFSAADTITGVSFIFDEETPAGTIFTVNIYNINADGSPAVTMPIATSADIVKSEAVGTSEEVTAKIGTGGIFPVAQGDTLYFSVRRKLGNNGVAFLGADSTGTNINGTSELFFEVPAFGISIPFGITEAPIIRLETKAIDNTNAVADLQFQALSLDNEYFSIPLNLVSNDNAEINFINDGLGVASNVSVSLKYTKPSGSTTLSEVVGDVASGEEVSSSFALEKDELGEYSITDVVLEYNDSLSISLGDTVLFEVTDSTLNRFDFNFELAFGYGLGDVGLGADTNDVGTRFSIPVADTMTAISFVPNPNFEAGDVFFGSVRDAESDVIVSNTVQITAEEDAAGLTVFRLPLEDPIILDPNVEYLMEVTTIQGNPAAQRSILLSDNPYFTTANTDYIRTGGQVIEFSTQAAIGEVSVAIIAEFGRQSTVGINENTGLSVELYPNPASEILNINNAADANYRLINIAGKTVGEGTIKSDKANINVANLKSGLYVLQLNGSVNESTRIVIK